MVLPRVTLRDGRLISQVGRETGIAQRVAVGETLRRSRAAIGLERETGIAQRVADGETLRRSRAAISLERKTGIEPATLCLGSLRFASRFLSSGERSRGLPGSRRRGYD